MGIVTDSEGDIPENVYAIHKLMKSEDELKPVYEEYKGRYGDLKKILVEDLEAIIAPMRERRDSITDDEVRNVLSDGAKRAKEISNQTLEGVRKATGIAI